MRRGLGLVLIGLGVAFLVLAPMVRWYVVPRVAVAPLDLDPKNTSDSAGTVATVIDLAAGGTESHDVALLSTRRTKADVVASEQAGGNIGVYDSLSTVSLASNPSGTPFLPTDVERYAFDRTTSVMVATAGANVGGTPITDAMIGTDTIMPLKMPFFSEKRTYSVFDSTLMKGAPADFVGEDTVNGLATYKYEQKIEPVQVGEQAGQPLWYQNDQVIWVEPVTGQIVNGYQQVKQWLKNADGSAGTVLIDGKIGFTDQEVADSVAQASANSSKLNFVANILPVLSLVLGVVVLVVGLLLVRRPDGLDG